MDRFDYVNTAYTILVIAIVLLGNFGVSIDYRVDPEYFSGILASSSILFGFWFVAVERTTKGTYMRILRRNLIYCLVFLAVSVISVFFAALDMVRTAHALLLCMFGFFSILSNVAITLWWFPFSD